MSTKQSMKTFEKAGVRVLIFALSLLLLSSSAFGQGTSSSALSGTVLDKNGAVIKGASVTATNKANGQSRTATTNDAGEYKIDFLAAGSYDIKVSASGFGDVTSENVQ
jgi:hypothetical protein